MSIDKALKYLAETDDSVRVNVAMLRRVLYRLGEEHHHDYSPATGRCVVCHKSRAESGDYVIQGEQKPIKPVVNEQPKPEPAPAGIPNLLLLFPLPPWKKVESDTKETLTVVLELLRQDANALHAALQAALKERDKWASRSIGYGSQRLDLKEELAAERTRVNDLNNLLRRVGWGQGEIDSSATLAEKFEVVEKELVAEREKVKSLEARIAKLKATFDVEK